MMPAMLIICFRMFLVRIVILLGIGILCHILELCCAGFIAPYQYTILIDLSKDFLLFRSLCLFVSHKISNIEPTGKSHLKL